MSSGDYTPIPNGTHGSQETMQQNELDIVEKTNMLSVIEESTASVWQHLSSTQDTYNNTCIPKSFEIDVPISQYTPNGKMWTHGNATEHMVEAVNSVKNNPRLKNSNPKLYSQFILYDYYRTLENSVRKGIKFERVVKEGKWEFIFAKPRKGNKYPVVKHAVFSGI